MSRFFSKFFGSKHIRVNAGKRKYQPAIEALEDRRLMTTATLDYGILTITGTDASDTITVRQVNGALRISGVSETFTTSYPFGPQRAYQPLALPVTGASGAQILVNSSWPQVVQAIIVLGKGGNDEINLNSVGTSGRFTYEYITVPTILRGGDDNDTIYGGAGRDYIFGDNHDDRLSSYYGNDRLEGGAGNDHLNGGYNGDTYAFDGADLGFDTFYEPTPTTGADRLDFSEFAAGVVIDLNLTTRQSLGGGNLHLTLPDSLFIEDVTGSAFADTITGNGLDNVLEGRGDRDTLRGGDGNDILRGGEGADTLEGGNHNDRLYGGAHRDNLSGGAGDDALFGGAGVDTVRGGGDDDRFLSFKDMPGWLGIGKVDPDTISDLHANDARINFEDGTGDTTWFYGEMQTWSGAEWTDSEIEMIDVAFYLLNHQIGNNTLLKKSDGGELSFIRQGEQTNTTKFKTGAWNRSGTISMIDVSFNGGENGLVDLVIHEIGHNWDTESSIATNFQALSGWRDFFWPWDSKAAYTQSPKDSGWYFLTSKANTFVSTYAKSNPYEDFAESFAAFFLDAAGRSHDHNLDAGAAKIDMIRKWVNTL